MGSNFTRRDFLKWTSAGAGAAAMGAGIWSIGRNDGSGTRAVGARRPTGPATTVAPGDTTGGTAAAAAPGQPVSAVGDLARRRLVVVEFDGGNDGLSTLVPYGVPAYYDLRASTAIGASDVLALDDQAGFHRNLTNVQARGLAAVEGVGSFTPDGSHFEMMRRWWAGDADGSGAYDTGFLGRLADAIGDPSAPAVALSIGSGSHPALISRKVSTLALPSADAARYVTGATNDDQVRWLFQQAFAAFSDGDGDGALAWLRSVDRQTIGFASTLAGLADQSDDPPTDAVEYPGSNLGNGLRLAASLVSADNGLRIVHVPMGGDFDTHEDHVSRHAGLLSDFDAAMNAFLDDLDRRGVADQVLVMTASEFGRRARDNGSGGLDHGTASTALLAGPVNPGRYGASPSLTDLDENDNLVATVGLDAYYATVAERWFGVPAGELFTQAPELIDGLLV